MDQGTLVVFFDPQQCRLIRGFLRRWDSLNLPSGPDSKEKNPESVLDIIWRSCMETWVVSGWGHGECLSWQRVIRGVECRFERS